MDLLQLCMGCMNEKNDLEPCPQCGWAEGTLPESYQYLLPRTMLNEGRYLVGRVIGQGAFGITYIAWDINLHRRVAIKEFFPYELVYREEGHSSISINSGNLEGYYLNGLEKFFAEAKTLVMFDEHPNIISVRDYFKANGTAYLVMNYLEGITLKELLARTGGRLEPREALEIIMPVMDALQAVHARGVLHRDVSPDNIFITVDRKVILIDFGAARQAVTGQGKGLSVIIKHGYAPEEQYRSQGVQGPWTDIYAAAATLYRVITGRMPPQSLERLESPDPLLIPSRLGVAITRDEEAALLKALSVRAENRFQSIREFRDALRGVHAAHGASGPPDERQPPERVDSSQPQQQARGPGETLVGDGISREYSVRTAGPGFVQPSPGRQAWWIEIVDGPDRGQRVGLETGDIVIGRDPATCSLVLSDQEVSRRHARIALPEGGFPFIEDMGSTNGTSVNGRLITEKTNLATGDVVVLGNSRLALIVVHEPGAGHEALHQPPRYGVIVNIGRAQANDIVLEDKTVSRRHACIYSRQGSYWLSDMGSMHGTYLNGLRLSEPVELVQNSQITIGESNFYFDGRNLLNGDGKVAAPLQSAPPAGFSGRTGLLFAAGIVLLLIIGFILLYLSDPSLGR